VSTLVLAEDQSRILASLRRLKGRGTVGDVIADSGLSADNIRAGLKTLLESHQGHLAVADSGELIYEFDPKLIERGSEPLLARMSQATRKVVQAGFKVWIVTMLVVYFAIMVALVIAALFANKGGNDSRGGWGGGRRGRAGGGLHFDPFIWYWIWGPRWRIGRPYYGRRWERTLDEGDKVPFYKKVFAFVFGPDRPRPTQAQLDRAKLRLIRARNGVLTTAELISHTGSAVEEAESEMGRLMGAYDGDAVASPNGEVVYAFPGVMASVEGNRSVREPNPAWLRLEHPQELTGNTAGANAIVAGMNTFTMVAAATSPWFIFPRLGITGPAAFIGLVVVPLVFSVLFFAGPMVRMAGVGFENRRRKKRNVRRILLGLVYRRALDRGAPVGEDEAWEFVQSRMPEGSVSRDHTTAALRQMASEFDADVSTDEQGTLRYAFKEIRDQFAASEAMRSALRLEQRDLGDVVFSTADSSDEAAVRDLELFDRSLLSDDAPLDRRLPVTDRIDFEDDYELVAFDEELSRQGRSGMSQRR
jgi:hypothetical protein